MKITRLPDVRPPSEDDPARSVAVGTFDGVHLGHRAVIAGSDSVLTFDPHPVSVVAPQHTPKLLTTLEVKAELIAGLGVQELIVIPFDADFAARSADEFIAEVLVGALGARSVAIGENFRFGHRAQGDPRLLAADERFQTIVHPLLEVDGEIVSSSHIRGLVLAGEVDQAARFLGAPFQLRGEVIARRRAWARAGVPDRQPRARGGARVPRPRGVRVPGQRRCTRRRQHRRAPDVRDRSRRADRGVPDRLRRRPVRQHAAPGLPRASARRAALRHAARR